MKENRTIIAAAIIAISFLSGCDWNSSCGCSKKKEQPTASHTEMPKESEDTKQVIPSPSIEPIQDAKDAPSQPSVATSPKVPKTVSPKTPTAKAKETKSHTPTSLEK